MNKVMDINSKEGTKVVYNHDSTRGDEQDRLKTLSYLTIGKVYTVNKVKIGSWKSKVELKEVPGVLFNTVLFDNFEEVKEQPIDDVTLKMKNIYIRHLHKNTGLPNNFIEQCLNDLLFDYLKVFEEKYSEESTFYAEFSIALDKTKKIEPIISSNGKVIKAGTNQRAYLRLREYLMSVDLVVIRFMLGRIAPWLSNFKINVYASSGPNEFYIETEKQVPTKPGAETMTNVSLNISIAALYSHDLKAIEEKISDYGKRWYGGNPALETETWLKFKNYFQK